MATKTPAREVAGSISSGPQLFYVQKKHINAMLVALQGAAGNQFTPPTTGLKDRGDLSGKFARRVGQNRRALERIAEMIGEERQELVKIHAAKYPEVIIVDGEEQPHPKAGEPTPVYQSDPQTGAPIFVQDRAGNPTDERAIVPDQYNVSDPMKFQKDLREMMDEFVVVECVGFTADEFQTFTKIEPRLIDPLMDIEVDGPKTATPAKQIDALRKTAAMFAALADRMTKALEEPAAAVVEEEEEQAAGEAPSAP